MDYPLPSECLEQQSRRRVGRPYGAIEVAEAKRGVLCARKVHAAMRLSQRLARAGPHARWEVRLRAPAERRVVAEIEGDELLGLGDRVRAEELRDEASEVGLRRSWGPRACWSEEVGEEGGQG